MIISIECGHCYGHGRVHSPGCNGDPDDDGRPCPACDGAGVVDHDLDEECDDE